MEESETNEEYIYSLIIDEMDSQISPEKRRSLEQWRSQNPENELTYQEFVAIQQHIDKLYGQEPYTEEQSWAGLSQKIDQLEQRRHTVVRKFRPAIWISVAASLLLICSLAYYFISYAPYTVVSNTQAASIKTIYLPDGSKMNLNTGAKVRYNASAFNSDRTVELLEGEVFVKVKHDDRFPFIVDLGELHARDIGTSFNIIKDRTGIILTVEEGKVDLRHMASDHSAVLTEGLTGRYLTNTDRILTEENQDINYKAWVDKHFVFTETPLEEVARQLSEAYKVNIVVNGAELMKKKLTADLHYQTPDSALNVIAATLQCDLEPSGKGYTLSAK